jgi:DNA polymerase-3 subunit alpha
METFCNTPVSLLTNLEALEGKEIRAGGIVSGVEHRLTKKGKPFGKLVIEDYSGKFECIMWSEEYIKFKSFLTPGYNLFIEGTVSRKVWGDHTLEFKIRNIELLHDLGSRRTKGIQLTLNAEGINADLIKKLEILCKKYEGKTPLYFKIRDQHEQINLELLSRKFQVKPVDDFVKQCKRLPDVELAVI